MKLYLNMNISNRFILNLDTVKDRFGEPRILIKFHKNSPKWYRWFIKRSISMFYRLCGHTQGMKWNKKYLS